MRSFRTALVLSVLALSMAQGGNKQRKGQRPRPVSARQTEAQRTCDGQDTFELITGFVYSAADDIIDSSIGVLKLVECLEKCLENPQCQAINFETGLCVLFKTAVGENTGEGPRRWRGKFGGHRG